MKTRKLSFQLLEDKLPLDADHFDDDHLDHEVMYEGPENVPAYSELYKGFDTEQAHAKERVFTYKVVHKNALREKNWGKLITEQEINESIFKGLQLAFGYKAGLNFVQKDSGYTNFVFYVQNDRNTAAGYYRSDQYIVLEALDNDRGWSDHKIRVIAAHEVGHSPRFWGSGHDSSNWYDSNGTQKHHLMHPWVNRLGPTYTSPKERNFLISRYGPDLELKHELEDLEVALKQAGRNVRPYRDQIQELRSTKSELISDLQDNREELQTLNNLLKNTKDKQKRQEITSDKALLLLQRDDLKSSLLSVDNDIKNTFPEYKVLREIRIGILSDISLILELQSQL